MFYLKRIPWKGSVIISERLNTNHCQIQRWQNFVHICPMQHTSSWGARNEGITRYMFLRHGLDTWRKISSRHTKNCAPVFAIVSVLKLPLCGLVVFIDINTYILTGGKNLKIFLQENYTIVLDNCYLFTKKCWALYWTLN